MRFNKVFCKNSICTPSRPSIITGQYPQTDGVLELLGWIASEEDELGNGSPRTRATRGGKKRDLFVSGKQSPSWKYNNVQAVRGPPGTVVDGMVIFYVWRDPVNPVV